eukprot:SAG25_NODE_12021_length_289_cov_1.094737_1_plen_49_part_10
MATQQIISEPAAHTVDQDQNLMNKDDQPLTASAGCRSDQPLQGSAGTLA